VLSRIQQTIKQSAIYTLPGIAGQIIGIILVPIYTRIFVPTDYGIMAGVALAIPIVTLLLALGGESAIARYYLDTRDERDRKLTASTALYSLGLLNFLVIAVAVLFFSEEISQLVLEDRQYSTYFIVALAAIPFGICYRLALGILRYKFQATRRTIISIAHMLVNIGLTIYFVVFLRIGIVGVYLATLITQVVFSSVVLLMVRRNYALVFSFKRLKELLAFGVPLVPAAMMIYIFHFADRYMLIRMASLEELGLYSVGVTIASVIVILTGGFRVAWMPIVYSSFREEESKQFYARIFDYFWSLIFLGAIGISLFSKEILFVLTPPTYLSAYTVVPIVVLGVVFFNAMQFFTFGISISKKTQYRLYLGIIAAALNVGLNFLLIPRYGMVGAAIATLISSTIYAVSSFLVSQKLYYVGYDLKAFFRIFIVTAGIISAGYLFFSDITVVNIFIKIALVGVFIASVYLFGLVGKEELRYLRQSIRQLIVYLKRGED